MNPATISAPLFAGGETDRPAPSRREMERAFLSGDATYDGVFFVAVKSTGIFCRPSCRAKKPLPENVEFMTTAKSALFAGYRPCLRCRPLDIGSEGPEWVRRLLQAVEQSPERRFGSADLRNMGIDPARARRYFAATFGLTFQEYSRGRRLGRALETIRGGGNLNDAVFAGGYESHSGFRESFTKTFGHPPGKLDSVDCIQAAWMDTPLGPMIAGASADGLCLLEFTDRRMLEKEIEFLRQRLGKPIIPGETELHKQVRKELEEYFLAKRTEFTTPLIRIGSQFEDRVWGELLKIPYGQVRSYEHIAIRIGKPAAVRAVGRANGRNHVAVIIPCHRVINKSGELGGYGGGLWRKRLLLHLERTARPLSEG